MHIKCILGPVVQKCNIIIIYLPIKVRKQWVGAEGVNGPRK